MHAIAVGGLPSSGGSNDQLSEGHIDSCSKVREIEKKGNAKKQGTAWTEIFFLIKQSAGNGRYSAAENEPVCKAAIGTRSDSYNISQLFQDVSIA